ncbi:MAG: DNA mismatch repair endonuclease MutL [Oscillospiraceae bacterium]|jgi:DNA mismatch repair protein MutL|nr:DNA mismatch repair endonuclease MutL [Oscillospiraceae bacterium]
MSEINILSPHVADLIAAGEVVERPASVIKELLENAFDAGAGNITAELRGGGMTYIRVTDDGCGMLPEDAGLCFMRHATSKLRDERGLEGIGTMGFRGEALAAIAAVSRTELTTRKKGTQQGTRVLLEAGEISEIAPRGCPEGTTLIVRDLFFNTPARLKFMKTDKAEAAACAAVALRCALGRPEVSVRLIKDGEELFFSPGDGQLSSCIYSLLGRDTAKELLACASEDEGIAVSGFVGSPRAGHGNRTKQFFFCNGRSIKSQLLQAAVEQAYRNTLLTGRYPACVIGLRLSFGAVDVNVHPAKTEVKFRDEKKVFDAVYYAALSAVEGESRTAEISLSPATRAAAAPKKDFYKTLRADEFRAGLPQNAVRAPGVAPPRAGTPASGGFSAEKGTVVWNRAPAPGASAGGTLVRESGTPYRASPRAVPAEERCPSPEAAQTEPAETSAAAQGLIPEPHGNFRLIGEAMKTYILAEKDDSLILIDKHAAHERMIFDRLKKQDRALMSQTLLVPVTLRLLADEIALLERSREALEDLGFEIEPFGADSVVIRSLPADTDAADAAAMVEEICEQLGKNGAPSGKDALDGVLHTVACKAAIRAGRSTEAGELNQIVAEVVAGRVKYCPHGRPVAVTLTKKQLDKEFSRIV